eukprot:CAMPEP_0171107634 /NCGR_PEP_ID=MMETSP0766_2-20121228/67231_1 /TAXON_ID=439317 /ORGANISM="Gambierdiscus australes, Strain CAWD 149" /LENGTH=42 /DNA_ID= /DNA_START= /DNA_END= /DNA_ORIENTATION=
MTSNLACLQACHGLGLHACQLKGTNLVIAHKRRTRTGTGGGG